MNQFFLIASAQLRCTLSDLGAAIASVEIRTAEDTWQQVALSPRNFVTGAADPSLAGRTIAPCCGRVRDGVIEIQGKRIQLAKNEGENHIHGGPHGAAYQIWRCDSRSADMCVFSLRLPDGLDGYPGNRTLKAEYRIDGGTLKVTYSAVTDRPAWIDMTNHAYWDLSGRFDGSAQDQLLEISADHCVQNDDRHLPVCIVPADGPFDFRQPVSPREHMRQYPSDGQVRTGRGYNHAFLLNRDRSYAAKLFCPETGVQMTLRTDQNAVVFYSGGFLDAQTQLPGGGCVPGCALALEAQDIPDPFHLEGRTAPLLMPDTSWQRKISWEFSAGIPAKRL